VSSRKDSVAACHPRHGNCPSSSWLPSGKTLYGGRRIRAWCPEPLSRDVIAAADPLAAWWTPTTTTTSSSSILHHRSACSPSTRSAPADGVLVPLQCEYYALEGLSDLQATVSLVGRSLQPRLDIEGILPVHGRHPPEPDRAGVESRCATILADACTTHPSRATCACPRRHRLANRFCSTMSHPRAPRATWRLHASFSPATPTQWGGFVTGPGKRQALGRGLAALIPAAASDSEGARRPSRAPSLRAVDIETIHPRGDSRVKGSTTPVSNELAELHP